MQDTDSEAQSVTPSYRRLVQEAFTDIFLLDADTSAVLDASRGGLKNLGYTADELRALRFSDIDGELDSSIHSNPFAALGSGPLDTAQRQTRLRRKDGSTFPARLHLQRMRLDAQPVIVVFAQEDVGTQQIENLQSLINYMPNCLILVDSSHHISIMNKQAELMLGYRAGELAGQSVDMLVPERYRIAHTQWRQGFSAHPMQRPMGSGRSLYARKKDGTELPVEIGLTPIQYEGEQAVLCSIVDISERQRADNEKDRLLNELRQKHNEMSCLHGMGELLRSDWSDADVYFAVADILATGLSDPVVTGARVVLEGAPYDSTGCNETTRAVEADLVINAIRRGSLALFLDDTLQRDAEDDSDTEHRRLMESAANYLSEVIERKEAEARLLQASKLAAVGELAAGVGHELNNPINGIINCADILLKSAAPESKEQKFLTLIRKESDRVATIVRNLLAFSRQDTSQYSPCSLGDIVELVLGLCGKSFEKSHIKLGVVIPPNLPPVRCRNEQIQQVLMNLLINAAHALDERYPEGEPNKVLRISAKEAVLDGVACVCLSIEDHGTGIAPHHRERIFDPFFTTKGRDKGTGLGLSISATILREHGGAISVDSEFGSYTLFQIHLPTATN